MFKKTLTVMLAVAILLVPSVAFAASTVRSGNIIYYHNKIDTDLVSYNRQLEKVERVRVAMTKLSTDNEKLSTKLHLLEDQMDDQLAAAKTGLDRAAVLQAELNVGDPKSEIKGLKKELKKVQKNIKKASATREGLKHRLENLRIVVNI